ncbi:MAG: ATP-dependent Clp protease ATP-binding subunit, partial [Acidobacteriota bacterium]
MSGGSQSSPLPLSFGAEQLISAARRHRERYGHAALGTHHWLLALLRQAPSLAAESSSGVDPKQLEAHVLSSLQAGDAGAPLGDGELIGRASDVAVEAGRKVVATQDLAAVLFALKDAGGQALVAAPTERRAEGAAAREVGARPVASYRPRASRHTPHLDKFGRDLTKEALEGKLPRIVGREREIDLISEILCRRSKRNPALVGPAGSGKTAIVEGLAQQIVAGDVPEPLHGARLIEIQPSNLTAGAGIVGELEKRMKDLLEEASQDGIILFIDEVHSVVGAGGRMGVGDVGAQLKPALARGALACIGATTDDEYRRFIEPDRALERRFNRVRVQAMTPEQTRPVLIAHREKLRELFGVDVPDTALDWLLDFAEQYLPNRFFPDKGVDLLEQCVAHAVKEGRGAVEIGDARAVAERMIGMPVDMRERLELLRDRLAEQGLLPQEDIDELLARLNVTLRGLDVRPQRPNGIVLLTGPAAMVASALARTLAHSLYGDGERVVDVDFTQFDDASHVNTLVGPPPGYVGFGERLPLHEIAQAPWSVLLCRGIDGCHPEVREVLTRALADGVLTERNGKRIYLSDAIVLLSAGEVTRAAQPLGFGAPRADESSLDAESLRDLGKRIGSELAEQIDVVFSTVLASESARQQWVEQVVLSGLAQRYRQQ